MQNKICSCKKTAVYSFEQQHVCKNCFLRLFKNRIKRALSEKKLKKDDVVVIENDCAAMLVKEIIPLPIKGINKAKTYDAKILASTLDDEAVEFFDKLSPKDEPNTIKIFKYLSEDEVSQFSKIKSCKFTPKPKNPALKEFLDAFQKYPDMKNNLIRNIEELKKIKS